MSDKNNEVSDGAEKVDPRHECPHCKKWGDQGDTVEVVVRSSVRFSSRIVEEWCTDCADNDSFECECDGCRYSTDSFTTSTTEDTSVTFCYEVNRGNYHYSDQADAWFEDRDEMPENQPTAIEDYHAGHRDWMGKRFSKEHLGLELEIEANNRDEIAEWVCGLGIGFICEHDGSLDSHRGVEIIAPPLGPIELANDWGIVLSRLRREGVDTPSRAGLHANMDQVNFGDGNPDKRSNLFTLVHRYHRWFKKFTGRDSSYGQYLPTYRWGNSMPYDREHIAISAAKAGRIEWRIFPSTVEEGVFKAFMDLTHAATRFACTAPDDLFKADSLPPIAREWRRFLKVEAGRYPALVAHAAAKGMVNPRTGGFLSVARRPVQP